MSAGQETCEYCQQRIARQEQAYVTNGKVACEQCDKKLRVASPPPVTEAEAREPPPIPADRHPLGNTVTTFHECVRKTVALLLVIGLMMPVFLILHRYDNAIARSEMEEHRRTHPQEVGGRGTNGIEVVTETTHGYDEEGRIVRVSPNDIATISGSFWWWFFSRGIRGDYNTPAFLDQWIR